MVTGPHHKFADIEFWAEDGVIFIEDHRDGTFKVDTCRDFAYRAKAVNEEARSEMRRGKYPDEHKRLVDCICDMYACFKEAKNQGDPSDPKVAAQKYRERRKVVLMDDTGNAELRKSSTQKKLYIPGF